MISTAPPTDPYPTRTFTTPRFIDRTDPVVARSQTGPLTPSQVSAYETDGALVVNGLFDDNEVSAIRRHIADLVDDVDTDDPTVIVEPGIVDPGTASVRSIFAFHRRSDLLGRTAHDPRLQGVAQQLLGTDVRVHQSRINRKPPFTGAPFDWHSDFETWHAEDGMPRMRAVSCVLLLSDNWSWNGPLLVMPGSHNTFVSCTGTTPEDHHLDSLRSQVIGVPDHQSLSALYEQYGIRECTGRAGTAIFFDCNTMHGSSGNMSPLGRENLFVVYNSVDNPLAKPFAASKPRPSFLAERY